MAAERVSPSALAAAAKLCRSATVEEDFKALDAAGHARSPLSRELRAHHNDCCNYRNKDVRLSAASASRPLPAERISAWQQGVHDAHADQRPASRHVAGGGRHQNNAFFTKTLGLRRVKKTVNFDAPDVYHLYYGDEVGAPGSVMTYFPFPDGCAGPAGHGRSRRDRVFGSQRRAEILERAAREARRRRS